MTSQSSTSDTAHDTVFDVDVERLARVYAQAVLDAAGADQDDVMAELRRLVTDVLNKFPDPGGSVCLGPGIPGRETRHARPCLSQSPFRHSP